jgi:hypothetical protein
MFALAPDYTNNFIVSFLFIQENNYYKTKTLLRINRKYICIKLGKGVHRATLSGQNFQFLV